MMSYNNDPLIIWYFPFLQTYMTFLFLHTGGLVIILTLFPGTYQLKYIAWYSLPLSKSFPYFKPQNLFFKIYSPQIFSVLVYFHLLEVRWIYINQYSSWKIIYSLINCFLTLRIDFFFKIKFKFMSYQNYFFFSWVFFLCWMLWKRNYTVSMRVS